MSRNYQKSNLHYNFTWRKFLPLGFIYSPEIQFVLKVYDSFTDSFLVCQIKQNRIIDLRIFKCLKTRNGICI